MAVIAALELDGECAAGKATRDTQRAHGGFGAGINQPHHLHRRNTLVDQLGQFEFASRGSTEAGAYLQDFLERVNDHFRPVTQHQRTPGTHVVDVLVSIDVEDARAFAPSDEGGRAANATKRANRRVDAAGDQLLGLGEERFGLGSIHHYSETGGTETGVAATRWGMILLRKKLAAISCRLPLRLRNRRSRRPR